MKRKISFHYQHWILLFTNLNHFVWSHIWCFIFWFQYSERLKHLKTSRVTMDTRILYLIQNSPYGNSNRFPRYVVRYNRFWFFWIRMRYNEVLSPGFRRVLSQASYPCTITYVFSLPTLKKNAPASPSLFVRSVRYSN